MSRLDNIYTVFLSTENYEELPGKQDAEYCLHEYLENNGLKRLDFEPYVNSVSSESMRQGFIYGFQYAVDLLIGKKVL